MDEQEGCLFISLTNPECPPTTGSFLVRPFEFLAVLNAVYRAPKSASVREELPGRLAAAAGGVNPPVKHSSLVGQSHLKKWWQHSWAVLWGPPGTGKTYTTGQQVAAVARASSLPAFVAEHSRAIWYVLDAEDVDLASIRAERGPGNRSSVRSITPSVLEKLFSNADVESANGLFISPYKAQAQAISQLFATWGANTWEASTVHSRQWRRLAKCNGRRNPIVTRLASRYLSRSVGWRVSISRENNFSIFVSACMEQFRLSLVKLLNKLIPTARK